MRHFSIFGMMNETMKLSELNGLIRQVLTQEFSAKLWVVAEISEMKTQRSGHCYLVLIEKDTLTDKVIAQARATIWSYIYRILRPYFETTTGQVLVEGLKVLVQVSVEFHELYGYSLNIHDIDPTYTLGDLARRKTDIINKLTREGVLDMNKGVDFPLVPQRIAVISSETAAGFQDFTNQLKNNQAGYVFYYKLFPAVMQGPQTEASVIRALETIYHYEHSFDVVVIIRGGGSQFDLSCFENYNMAYYVTQFPLPVITGIGHEKDNSVVDLVAHTRLKTPTAVAEFLIGNIARFDLRLSEAQSVLMERIHQKLDDTHKRMDRILRLAAPLIRGKISSSRQSLNEKLWKTDHFIKISINNKIHILTYKEEEIRRSVIQFLVQKSKKMEATGSLALSGLKMMIPSKKTELNLKLADLTNSLHKTMIQENHRLQMISKEIYLIDPQRILARGYSITTIKGLVIKDSSTVNPSDIVKTTLYKGTLYSQILAKEEDLPEPK